MYNFDNDIRYLELLSNSFPTIAEASTEIINLQAILNLPKGTEHFLADIHGEYEAFQHVLKNASGNITANEHKMMNGYMIPIVDVGLFSLDKFEFLFGIIY